MRLSRWFSRSPGLLSAGLVALGLGFFIEGRGWWNALFDIIGVALIAIWSVAGDAPPRRQADRRLSLPDRRQHAIAVRLERRTWRERRALAGAY
jgi:hypothetical protein